MKNSNVGEVIKKLTTHEQIMMMHNIMENEKIKLNELKKEVKVV